MDENGCFTRDFELENSPKILTFYQKEVGDVSCVIWDASLVLARYLEKRARENPTWLTGTTVLELGSGVGCAGIVAACCGADVTMTDLPQVLPLLEHNIAANRTVWSEVKGLAKACELEWGQNSSHIPIPRLLILADCIYYPESIKPLVKTLCLETDDCTEIILCQELRDTEKQKKVWESFMSEALQHFQFSVVPFNEQHPVFRSTDIVLMKGVRR